MAEPPNTPVLVVGGDGLVGHALADTLAASRRVVYRTTRRVRGASKHMLIDLRDPNLDRIALPEVDTVFLCAGVNGFANCRADPGGAYAVNVAAAELLSRRLIAQGSRVIALSSSAVFDFRQPRRLASDPACPTTVYGRIEAEKERRLLALGTGVTIVRLSKVLTHNGPRFAGWLRALAAGERIGAYSDLHFCPVPLEFVAKGLIRIATDTGGGIYHLSGFDDLSYLQAIRYLARKIGRDESRVLSETAADHGIPPEEIATFTSLDTSRYTALSGQLAPMPLAVLDEVFAPVLGELVLLQ